MSITWLLMHSSFPYLPICLYEKKESCFFPLFQVLVRAESIIGFANGHLLSCALVPYFVSVPPIVLLRALYPHTSRRSLFHTDFATVFCPRRHNNSDVVQNLWRDNREREFRHGSHHFAVSTAENLATAFDGLLPVISALCKDWI